MNPLIYKIVNLVAFVVNLAITYGSLTGIFGPTNTILSLKYQTLVTPSGWAFSIWGLIFIWEGVFAVFSFLPKFRESEVFSAIAFWWVGVCVTQVGWSIAFAQEQQGVSLAFMLSILLCLAAIAVRLSMITSTYLEFWLLKGPFYLQLGWILAASAVNFNVVIDASVAQLMGPGYLSKNGTLLSLSNPGIPDGSVIPGNVDAYLNPKYWNEEHATLLLGAAVISLGVLTVIGSLVALVPRRVNGNVITVGVVAWALGGVADQLSVPVFKTTLMFSSPRPAVFDQSLPKKTVIIDALGGAAAFMSIGMILLVVYLVGKLIFDEFLRPRCKFQSDLERKLKSGSDLEGGDGGSPVTTA